MKKSLLSILILLTVLSSSSAFASKDGGSNTGGGNGVGNRLFDFIETAPEARLKGMSFYPIVKSVMTTLYSNVPQLAVALQRSIDDSKWTLDSRALSREGCIDESMSAVQKQVIACQNEIEIRLLKSWLTNPKVSEMDKAGLIIHEAVRRSGANDPVVTQVTRDIFDLHSGRISQIEFLKRLNDYGLFVVGIREYVAKAVYCSNLDKLAVDLTSALSGHGLTKFEGGRYDDETNQLLLVGGVTLANLSAAGPEDRRQKLEGVMDVKNELERLRNEYRCK